MATLNTPIAGTPVQRTTLEANGVGAVSWAAIFVGAVGAAALSLVLVMLGFGLGLSSVSPWTGVGASAGAIGIAAAVWIGFTQIAASATGGYLAGRLRVKWSGLHTDEVYFRDTAHGFMAWAVATLVTFAVLGSAVTSILQAGVQASGSVVGKAADAATSVAAQADSDNSKVSYFTDSLFRNKDPEHATVATPTAAQADAAKIFVHDLSAGSLSAQDKTYLGTVVAQATGANPADAEKRVSDTFDQTKATMDQAVAKAKEAADAARKAARTASLWMFVGLMLGAFFASFAAIYGGRRRDLMV